MLFGVVLQLLTNLYPRNSPEVEHLKCHLLSVCSEVYGY